MSTQGTPLLNGFKNIIKQSLKQPKNNLKDQAHSIAISLLNAYQGQQIYFPKLSSTNKAELHRKINANFTGKNQIALAKKYQLSIVQIYNITRSKNETTNT